MAYAKQTFASEEEAQSSKMNQLSDNIELCLRGKTANRIVAMGKDTPVAGAGSVVFATDADDGDPGFSTVPNLQVTPIWDDTSTSEMTDLQIHSLTTSGFSYSYTITDADPADSFTIEVHWLAIGT